MTRETIVVKYGSVSVACEQGMDRERLGNYTADLATLRQRYGLIVVSSGSVAVGRSLWRQSERAEQAVSDRSLAMLGSGRAFTAWQEAFAHHGVLAGQLPITHREVDDPKEGRSLLSAIQENLASGIVTVANENDALSDIELAKLSYGGDNDGLAAHLAVAVRATALVLMTNQNGLKCGDKTIAEVGSLTHERAATYQYIEQHKSPEGRGGMESKFKAAADAADAGIDSYIASASHSVEDILNSTQGTHFVAVNVKR